MTRTFIILSILALLPSTAPVAADRCSNLRADASVAAAVTVGVFADPRLPAAVADRAVDAWGTCASHSPDLPRLEIGRSGTRDLFVEFDPAAIGPGERCGSFRGRTIRIFARTRTHHGHVVSCGSLSQNLTHEIGHALGLADAPPSCGSFAMAKLNPNNGNHRRVRPGECRALSARWVRLPIRPRSSATPADDRYRVAASSLYP